MTTTRRPARFLQRYGPAEALQVLELAARAKAAANARPIDESALVSDDVPPPERPGALIDFTKRFNPKYRDGAFHRYIAAKVEQALARRCVHCNRPGIASQERIEALRDGEEPAEPCDGSGSPYGHPDVEGHEFQPLNRLMVFTPPQHGKSEIISTAAPAQYLGEHPDDYWVAASYESGLATRNSRHARNIVRMPDFYDLYGVRLARDSNSVTEWEFEGHRGGFYAVGVGGALTGRVADVLAVDDPIKGRQEADSPTIRENVWDWWKTTARSRLNPESVAILVMTRWHHDDLAGRILNGVEGEKGEGRVEDGGAWLVVSLPALAEEDDPLGRAPGEPLVIPHHNHQTLADALAWYEGTRESVGPRDWASVYQQHPSLDEDAILPRTAWGWYEWTELPPGFLYIIQFWDTAYKDKTRNDFNACVTLGVTGEAIYVLDAWRKRMQFPQLKEAVRNRRALYRPTHLHVEAKASGVPIVQELREEIEEISEWDPGERDKVSRAYATQPRVLSGSVKLPREADWLGGFLDECEQFPLAAHDDYVDAFTGAMLVALALLAHFSAVRVSGGDGGNRRGWIDPRYIDRDTGDAPSPELVRSRL